MARFWLEGVTSNFEACMSAVTRILLVDNDDAFRRVLSTALRHNGYEVFEARGHAAAREHLETGVAHLVITDLDMPDGSGLDLLEWWREQGGITPFVLVTASGSDDARAKARKLGALDVLDKPFEIGDLDCVIRAVDCPG